MEEVRCAVFGMAPDKAPGPDGYSAGFYQTYWLLLRDSLLAAIRNFLFSREELSRINQTTITLIPKTSRPSRMSELRPISLCNVFYKIVAKVLSNRLKQVLPFVVSESQTGFVPGRYITDNVLVAHEAMHLMKGERHRAQGHFGLKLDMSKAYDRVEWGFLKRVMLSMGFYARWVDWIMTCVTTVSYKVLLNGQIAGSVIPKRGLRQGDPLSSYLFVLCAESLSGRLQAAERVLGFQPLRFGVRGPKVSHLFFADDSLILARCTTDNAVIIKQILTDYEADSGQSVNFMKSAVTFSKCVDDDLQSQIKDILGVHQIGGSGMYLGLPEAFGRSKSALFSYIKDRVKARTQSWYGKFLSPAGKEVLLKSVASAMPTYAMSVFLLPKGLIRSLTQHMSAFWWNSMDGTHRVRWTSWSNLQRPKCVGGLGFRDLEDFNVALLGKQAWRVLKNPENLLSQVYKHRYFRRTDFSEARLGSYPSWGWRSILKGREVALAGSRWCVRSGNRVSVWHHNWLPTHPPSAPSPLNPLTADANLVVAALLEPGSGRWNESALSSLVAADSIPIIRTLPLSYQPEEDVLRWHHDRTGDYTVKTGYNLCRQLRLGFLTHQTGDGITAWYNTIWSLSVPAKLRFFIWRACSNILPTKANYCRRGIFNFDDCPSCGLASETTEHILCVCFTAQQVWSVFTGTQAGTMSIQVSFAEWLKALWEHDSVRGQTLGRERSVWVCWHLWLARNALIYKDQRLLSWQIIQKADQGFNEWRQVHGSSAVGATLQQGTPPVIKPVLDLSAGGVVCSVDGAWQSVAESMGFGWIVCDAGGVPVSMFSKAGGFGGSALAAEAGALRCAVRQLCHSGFLDVFILSDCAVLIDALKHRINHVDVEPILQDIWHDVQFFRRCEFRHIPRRLNEVADALAKHAYAQSFISESFVVFPSWIERQCIPFSINVSVEGATSQIRADAVVSGSQVGF